MAYSLDGKLVVGISSRALFDLVEEDAVYRSDGLAAYRQLQREREQEPLRPGTGFRLVRALLAINERRPSRRLVEVVILSKNDGDSGVRIFNSIEHHGLDISRAALTGGRPVARFLRAFRAQLFLSAEASEVAAALEQGIPAALVLAPPPSGSDATGRDVLIAFDGDAVLFDDEADRIHRTEGLEAFTAHELTNAAVPMRAGPFEPFLRALARLQAEFPDGAAPIRTALVTARGAPAHRRVITTLRDWGVRLDESYFLGGIGKAEVVASLEPLIFFDDQLTNLADAQERVPSAHVPYEGPQRLLFSQDAVHAPVSTTSVALLPPAEPEDRREAIVANLRAQEDVPAAATTPAATHGPKAGVRT
jgi:5'-nucleotidase